MSIINRKISQLSLQQLAILSSIFLMLSGCSATRKTKLQEQEADAVIRAARSYIGTPYKWGGTTRSGIDCSGLITNAFSAIKQSLPRTADAQAAIGEEIGIADIKPGDLVFFATGKKKKEITHVGIVTTVKAKDDIKFIHASTSLGVIETNLFSDYYKRRFCLAKRIID
ncbi:MAG: C40 family peptidase [Cytophagales bacterium]